jgi:hypothetical protein
MAKNFTFKTQRGATISFTATISHLTGKEVDADGVKVSVTTSEYNYGVSALTINGKPENGDFTDYAGKKVICYGRQGNHPLLIALPENIAHEIFGKEMNEFDANLDAKILADKKYQKHYDAVRKAMCD